MADQSAKKTPDRKRLAELEFLIKSSRLLNSTLDFDKLLGVILRIVKNAVAVESASVSVLDKDEKHLVYQLAMGKRGTDIKGLSVPVGKGISGWVARNKQPVVLDDAKKDKRYSLELERMLGLEARSIICVPLKRRGKLIGVLEGVNRIGGAPFEPTDLSIFTALGDHIAMAIGNARLHRQVKRKNLETRLFHSISAALSMQLTLDEVLHRILTSLKKIVYYDAAGIFVLDKKNQFIVNEDHHSYGTGQEEKIRLKLDEGIVGWSARNKRSIIVGDCLSDPRYVNARPQTRSEMVTPMLVRNSVIGVINLENDRLHAYGEDDLVLLESFAAYAAVAIERARLYEDNRKKRELQRQLHLARTVQEFFTPKKGRKVGNYHIRGINYPGLMVSGDYYDFFPLKNGTYAFAIADVAGQGIPASIIMSSFRASLHTAAIDLVGAKEIAMAANRILVETVRPQDFVSAFIGVLNPGSGEITYCNAGHEPPVLMRQDGSYRLLEIGGPILGVFDNPVLLEGRLRVDDEVLFCYTDGLTEARNAANEEFGLKRVVANLRRSGKMSAQEICSDMHEKLQAYVQVKDWMDDVTFLVVRKEVPEVSTARPRPPGE
ncbi:MAG: SpoIIE family protein phosphatase [Chitinivibrionia bacterium]|nr:SpoIIE family protein phosphatase [Chitinivibrionia bacterium]